MSRRICCLFLLSCWLSLTLAAPQPQSYEDGDDEYEQEIKDIPEFISTRQNITVAPGKQFRLQCQVNNLNPGILVMWSREDPSSGQSVILSMGPNLQVRGEDRRRYRVRVLEGRNPGGATLTVDGATEKDQGRYKCQVMVLPPKELEYNVRVGIFPDETTTEASVVGDGGDGGGASAASPASMAALLLLSALAARS